MRATIRCPREQALTVSACYGYGLEPAHDAPSHGNQRAKRTNHGLRFVFVVARGFERFPCNESLIPEPCAECGKYERKYGHVRLLVVVMHVW